MGSYGYSQFTTQNRFSRILANEEKAGGYYTDQVTCDSIRKSLVENMEQEGSVIAFDPTAGDGNFLYSTSCHFEDAKRFAIELRDEVADKLKEDNQATKRFTYILKADCMRTSITNQIATCLLMNPPYLSYPGVPGERMEIGVLDKFEKKLQKGGVCVLVIPKQTAIMPEFIKMWFSRFENLGVYKVCEKEYGKFHQYVFFGRKKTLPKFVLKPECEAWVATLGNTAMIPVLPEEGVSEKIMVPRTTKNFTTFESFDFPANAIREELDRSFPNDLSVYLASRLFQKERAAIDVGNPPIDQKTSQDCLCVVSGVGNGYAGQDGVNLHMQRGTTSVIEEDEIVEQDGKKYVEVTTRTQNTLTVIEQSGKINHYV